MIVALAAPLHTIQNEAEENDEEDRAECCAKSDKHGNASRVMGIWGEVSMDSAEMEDKLTVALERVDVACEDLANAAGTTTVC